MSEVLWQPTAERIGKTRMEAFRRFVNQRHHLHIDDYPALHQWSIDQRPDFWQAIVDFFDIRFHEQPDAVLLEGPQMPSARILPAFTRGDAVPMSSTATLMWLPRRPVTRSDEGLKGMWSNFAPAF